MSNANTQSDDLKRQTKEGYEPAESVDEVRETLESLEYGDKMLKTVVQGSGLLAGNCDEIRAYDGHDDELQIQPPLIGSCNWQDIDEIAERIVAQRLPFKVVEWEDRI